MIECPVCRSTIHFPGAKFCQSDGAALRESSQCECGQALHPVAKFCPMCGRKVAPQGKAAAEETI